jgi:long-chain acyl-CoA synthetase
MTYSYLPHSIRESILIYGQKVALRFFDNTINKWQNVTYSQLGKYIDGIANALISEGVGEQEMVGIFSRNMPEWTYSDFAVMSVRAVSIPIYPTDSPAQAAYIIRETNMKVIFVGEQEQYDKILKVVSDTGIDLTIIAFDSNVQLHNYQKAYHFRDFLESGIKNGNETVLNGKLSKINGDDITTILYTSGTTGEPKGVVLRYKNFVNMLRIHNIYLNNVDESDISLEFLPLSHIFERAWSIFSLHRGIQINYLLNPRDVVQALKDVKPTIMCTVPRFFEKTYNVVHEKLENYSPLKKKVFYWAIDQGRKKMDYRRLEQKVPVLDKMKYQLANLLVLKKGRQAFGGRIRLMPCAGAMLPDNINTFFHSVGIHIIYAYGLTETLATVTAFPHTKFKFSTVGQPLPDVQLKIGENNEILIKGESVFGEYYKKPEETRMAFTEDGWFKTGDAGEIDDEGNLIMKERIKDLIKTSLGKFVAPQQVESVLCSDSYIEQVVVIGDDRKFLTALIVPSFTILEGYAAQQKIEFGSREELVNNPLIFKMFASRLEQVQKDLANYQQVKKFALLPHEFSIDGGEFTSTLKVKRKIIAQKYYDLIEEMYRE